MKEPHVYIDADGVEWRRVWATPNASMGMNSDPDSASQFKDKTKNYSLGDMWDYSAELKEKRVSKRGHDHIGASHDKKRQSKIDSHKPTNKKKKQ
jgi:hypothetical protein